MYESDYPTIPVISDEKEEYLAEKDIPIMINKLTRQMKEAAKNLEYEEAARLRDRIKELSDIEMEIALWK